MIKRAPKASAFSPKAPTVPKSQRVADGIQDSLQNLITGMGTAGRDKSVSTQFIFNTMDRMQLENAYRADWIARKVVRIPAEDATREWRTWQSDNADIEKLEDAERDLSIQRKVFSAMWKGRLYGGAALLLGVNQGKLSEELVPEKVQQGSLKFIHVLSRHELAAGPMNWDVDSPYYGLPEYYTRAATASMSAQPMEQVHPSRIIRFIGNEIPDLQVAQGWGDSVLQAVNDAVVAAGTTSAAGAQLLQEAKMDIIKIPELSASMANKQYEKRLLDRFGMASLTKSLYNILLMDKDEDWERVATNFSGLDELLKMYLLIASGAADIPATRFIGQSPVGLSATGESDLRNYYDKCRSDQSCELAPNLDVLDRVLIRSTLGDVKDGDVVYLWRPLWQMDDKQKAEIAKIKADVYTIDNTAAQIPPDVLREARINQLIEDGTYPGLEQILDEYGEMDTLEGEEEDAMLIGPDGELLEPDPDLTPANENVTIAAVGKTRKSAAAAKAKKKKAVGDMADRIRDSGIPYWVDWNGTWTDENECHEPETGQFCATGGTSDEPSGKAAGSDGGAKWYPTGSSQGTVNGKDVQLPQYDVFHSGDKIGTVRAAVGSKQTSTHQGSRTASGRGEVIRYRAQPADRGKPATWHESTKKAVGQLKKYAGKDSLFDRKVDTLYVYRKVTNAGAILAHYRKQGVPDLFARADLHVTLCYSRTPVDWTKTGEAWASNEDGSLTIKQGGMRTMEKYGHNSLVLLFNNNELSHRHMDIRYRTESEWDYGDYTPHITVAEVDPQYDWSNVAPYRGVIELGPEIFEEVKTEGAYA